MIARAAVRLLAGSNDAERFRFREDLASDRLGVATGVGLPSCRGCFSAASCERERAREEHGRESASSRHFTGSLSGCTQPVVSNSMNSITFSLVESGVSRSVQYAG